MAKIVQAVGTNTLKYQAGKPCKFHDPSSQMSFGGIFTGTFDGSAYVILDDGAWVKIPAEWLT